MTGGTGRAVRLLARAKINYSLDITGVLPDGYHELLSVFQSVTLADELTLTPARSGFELTVRPEAADVGPEEGNTVHRAWRVLGEHTGGLLPVRAHLQKNVPAAGGLGGGSADGAATLVGLDALFGLGLDPETLRTLAVEVGADVPFCVGGGTALASGIGERLQALPPPPEHHLVVAKPPFEANTAEVYRAFDASPRSPTRATGPVVEALERGDLAALARSLGNDLAAVTEAMYPGVAGLRETLLRAGALGASMTGSGSAVFGVFGDRRGAERAAASLQVPFVSVCEPVGGGVEVVDT